MWTKEQKIKWRIINRDYDLARKVKYRQDNKEKVALYDKTYRTNNKDKRNFWSKLRAYRKKNALGSHSLEEWEALKKFYGYVCLCCKRTEPEIKLCADHIIPLTRDGSNWIENIQPLCRSCNTSKMQKIIDYRLLAPSEV